MMQIEVYIVGFAVWRGGVARQGGMRPDVYQLTHPLGSSRFMP
jgi:hypothetical protein